FQIDNEFAAIGAVERPVDHPLDVVEVVGGEPRHQVNRKLRMLERLVAFAEEGIGNEAGGLGSRTSYLWIGESQLGIDRASSGFHFGGSGSGDAQGQAQCGDDVEDRLLDIVSSQVSRNGSFDRLFVDFTRALFVDGGFQMADIGRRDGTFVNVI